MTLRASFARVSALAFSVMSLIGCAPASQEVHEWMTEQRRQTTPKVSPLSPPKRYLPLAYAEAAAIDPFDNQKLTQALQRDTSTGNPTMALVAPELNRRKEPLEAYPLDAMVMVGSLLRGSERVALVRVNQLLYQVRPGNYLGQNYGRVTKVGEHELALREIVQDATGEWIERAAALQLQEKTQ